jgi:hypothetical protein
MPKASRNVLLHDKLNLMINEKIMSDGACIGNRYTEHFAPHLRDVLPAVFAQLGAYNRPALPPLLRVCRAWAAAGIPLLWRQVSIDALLRIDDAARRQLYADAIQVLSFYNPCWHGRLDHPMRVEGLDGLRFPRLRRVDTLTRDHLLAAGAIAPFLQPRLEVLKCDARYLAAVAVQQRLLGAAQCRQLRELHLSDFRCGGSAAVRQRAGANLAAAPDASVHDDDDCRSLDAVIAALPALETLVAWSPVRWCVADLDLRLAALPRLKTLQGVSFDTQALGGVVRYVLQLFPALRELCAKLLCSDALPLLVGAVRDIEHLELAFGGPCLGTSLFIAPAQSTASTPSPFPFLQQLAPAPAPPPPPLPPWDTLDLLLPLRGLRKLKVCFPQDTVISRNDIVRPLLELPQQLRELSLRCRDDGYSHVRFEDFADADLAAVVGRLPRLTRLKIGAGGRLSARAFRTVGEACRELDELSLPCKCLLWALEGAPQQPLFPKLQVLECGEPVASRWYWEWQEWQ